MTSNTWCRPPILRFFSDFPMSAQIQIAMYFRIQCGFVKILKHGIPIVKQVVTVRLWGAGCYSVALINLS